jgi:D-proline reductase (dithiol) PrdB
MATQPRTVDGFCFMPPSLRAWIMKNIPEEGFQGNIPWTPMHKPIKDTTFSLMTSAGISLKTDPVFDMEREKREPTWGDPSFRKIPKTVTEADINVNHLHINTDYIMQDINVILPVNRFREFEQKGVIGELAPTSYSYYGFQLDPTILLNETLPEVASHMQKEGVEAVLLTPA